MATHYNTRKFVLFLAGVFILIFLSYTCITEFEPEVERYDDILVIEGNITDQEGPYCITVSRTYDYNDNAPMYETGAIVYIVSDANDSIFLSVNDDSEYETPSDFQGEVGTGYKLVVELDGEVYESAYEKLQDGNEIDTAYWERDTKLIDGVEEVGIRIYADTKGSGNDVKYYRWSFTETWEYETPYVETDWTDVSICWKTAEKDDIVIASSSGQTDNAIKGQEMYFLDRYCNKLYRRYCVTLIQSAITEDVYEFYKQLEEIESGGDLFETIPYSLSGNITCCSNADIPVLGLFEAASIQEYHLFIDNSEIPGDMILPPHNSVDCDRILFSPGCEEQRYIDSLLALDYIIADIIPCLGHCSDTCAVLYITQSCFDCTYNGNSNIKPDFWIDE